MLNHTVEEPFKTYCNVVVHFFHEDGRGGRMIGKGEAIIVEESVREESTGRDVLEKWSASTKYSIHHEL